MKQAHRPRVPCTRRSRVGGGAQGAAAAAAAGGGTPVWEEGQGQAGELHGALRKLARGWIGVGEGRSREVRSGRAGGGVQDGGGGVPRRWEAPGGIGRAWELPGVKWSSLRARWGWRGVELGPPREPWLGGREWGRGGAAQWRGGAGHSGRRGGAWAWGMGCGHASTRAARAKWRSEGARRETGRSRGGVGRRRRGWPWRSAARLWRAGVAELRGSSGAATQRGRGDDGGVACGRQVHGRRVWTPRRRRGVSPSACRGVRVNGAALQARREGRGRSEGLRGMRTRAGWGSAARRGRSAQRAAAAAQRAQCSSACALGQGRVSEGEREKREKGGGERKEMSTV
ncbi:hypothetical protein PVAP13_8NG329656 [Panicum virgatum]|uniref:Uncharacterized protein n=1 Tax=Panicum virgatum TaxID=38727 RepID=A0A8T0PE39_PANVG|nr:hypothetical protein PVAP13_8NG329656 [Panicum virgatum]